MFTVASAAPGITLERKPPSTIVFVNVRAQERVEQRAVVAAAGDAAPDPLDLAAAARTGELPQAGGLAAAGGARQRTEVAPRERGEGRRAPVAADPGLGAREPVERARRLRPRRVRRDAARAQHHGERDLVAHRHGRRLHAPARVRAQDPALVERERGVELVPVILGQPLDPVVAALLVGLEDEHDVARERDAIAREPHRRRREDRDAALVVERAAAVEVVAPDEPGERVDAPQVALDAHGVRVRGQQHGLADRRRAAEPRHEMRLAGGRRLDDLDLEPERRQPVAHVGRDQRLVAGGIGRVEPDEVAGERDDLGVGLARGRPGKRSQRDQGDDDRPRVATAGAMHGPTSPETLNVNPPTRLGRRRTGKREISAGGGGPARPRAGPAARSAAPSCTSTRRAEGLGRGRSRCG